MEGRTDGVISAEVVDPTGYTFELVERTQRDPLCQLMLRTADIEKSIKYVQIVPMFEQYRSIQSLRFFSDLECIRTNLSMVGFMKRWG